MPITDQLVIVDAVPPSLTQPLPRVIPRIELSGCWLSMLGFVVGASVRLEVDYGRLVLVAVESEH